MSGPIVTLREITQETVVSILDLKVRPDQEHFVASNAISIAQAYFEPKAWFRAIYADEAPVGFLMLYDDPEEPRYYLWRMMIDAEHQGKGYGAKAIALLADYVRTRPNATGITVGWVPGEGSPEPFYLGLGFVPTGEVKHGEVQGRLSLDG